MSAPRVRSAVGSDLAPPLVEELRTLLDAAFEGRFEDTDWAHALDGRHVWVEVGGRVVAHGSLVTRTLWHHERPLRAGYVEAVGVAPDQQGRGRAAAVMEALEASAGDHDVLALSSSEVGLGFYLRRGWVPWRGPTGVRAPHGDEPTPEDDGAVLLRPGRVPLAALDLDADLWCDWREGDVW